MYTLTLVSQLACLLACAYVLDRTHYGGLAFKLAVNKMGIKIFNMMKKDEIIRYLGNIKFNNQGHIALAQ